MTDALPTIRTRIALYLSQRRAPLLADGPPTPCACGGVLAWETGLRRYVHARGCADCAARGYIRCGATCSLLWRCSRPRPLTCPDCGDDLTVEGCTSCAGDPEDTDPDHLYDLRREPAW